MTYHFNICTVSPDDKFIVHFDTGQIRPGYHHCDEMNYELVIWTPGRFWLSLNIKSCMQHAAVIIFFLVCNQLWKTIVNGHMKC